MIPFEYIENVLKSSLETQNLRIQILGESQ